MSNTLKKLYDLQISEIFKSSKITTSKIVELQKMSFKFFKVFYILNTTFTFLIAEGFSWRVPQSKFTAAAPVAYRSSAAVWVRLYPPNNLSDLK